MNKIALAPTSLANTPPLEYVDACAKAGYTSVGIRLFRSPGITYPFYPVTDDPAIKQQVKAAISDSGMEIFDVLSFYMQPETNFDAMMAPLEFGKEIGASYALVIGDDPEWGRMVQNFGRFCDIAGGLGMVASLEAPVVSRQINTMAKALRLVEESGNKAVICIDPYQFHRVGDTPAILRGLSPKLLPYTQITDGYNDPTRGGRSGLGEGDVPLAEILDELTPELPLSLEWPAPRGSGYGAHEWAKMALEGTRRYLDDYYASRKK
jgi:sugar phosphate isomerase/epimerase